MEKIILVGYMAAGKTTIAHLLSEKTGFKALDLDKLIEKKTNLSISELFEKRGEIYFRKLENEMLKEVLRSDDSIIISTGGGTPCYANNHLLLREEGVISVYLKASIGTIFERLKSGKSERPLVAGQSDEELKEFIAKHLFDRSYFYHQARHMVTVDAKSTEEIAAEILALLH